LKANPETKKFHFSREYSRDNSPIKTQEDYFNYYDSEKLETGVELFSFETSSPKAVGYGFKIHRSLLKRRLSVALGKNQLLGTDTLSSIARKNNALAAINGSYFEPNGDPLGLLIKNHELISSPLYSRASFGINQNGKAIIGHPEFQGELITSGGKIKIDGINQITNADKSILYTKHFIKVQATKRGRIHLVIENKKLVHVTRRAVTIPENGFVMTISPENHPWIVELKPNTTFMLNYGLSQPWNKIKLAIGGGPRLLEKGDIPNLKKEHFNPSFFTQRAPRTAVGIDERGNLILIVADGRQKHSKGFTLKELATCMKELGAFDAVNLDGGGSTGLTLDGNILNSPSDGKERKISNALLVLQK
jgi:exopolysaccharide biosynthesis protein